MSINRLKTFYLHYSNLQCKVEAPEDWIKYFEKLYKESGIVKFSSTSAKSVKKANLKIVEKKSSYCRLKFISYEKNLTKFVIETTSDPLFFFLSVHQFVSRIFNILHHLSGGFVLHASVIYIEKHAYVFAGESGRGKSTIADLIKSEFPKSEIVADNSAFITRSGTGFLIFPSPYIESNRLNSLQAKIVNEPPFKLGSVFFPYHSKNNKISDIEFGERLSLIKNNSHISYDAHKLFTARQRVLFGRTIFDFARECGIYKLEFAPTKDFVYYLMDYVGKQKGKIHKG